MYIVSDTETSHIYFVTQIPALSYEAVKTLFYENDKDVIKEILDDFDFPSFEEFTNSIDEDDFFEFCGFYVDNYLLNELYRQ